MGGRERSRGTGGPGCLDEKLGKLGHSNGGVYVHILRSPRSVHNPPEDFPAMAQGSAF